MALWDKIANLPKYLSRKDKRSVVATDVGFVRKRTNVDAQGNVRKREEILVPIRGVANSTNFGASSIVDVWHSRDSAVINTPVVTYVAFDEPLTVAGPAKINVANTAGGSAKVAVAPALTSNAENTLSFTWTPTVAGVYKIQAQTIANNSATALNIRSTNSGTELASLVISGVASNTAGLVIVTNS